MRGMVYKDWDSVAVSMKAGSSNSVTMDPELWGNLPCSLVLEVYKRLPLQDFHQLRRVCKDWNSEACERRRVTDPILKPYFEKIAQPCSEEPISRMLDNAKVTFEMYNALCSKAKRPDEPEDKPEAQAFFDLLERALLYGSQAKHILATGKYLLKCDARSSIDEIPAGWRTSAEKELELHRSALWAMEC